MLRSADTRNMHHALGMKWIIDIYTPRAREYHFICLPALHAVSYVYYTACAHRGY